VMLSTHNLDEVERIADRVALLKSRLVALDTPAALRARVFGARVRIGVEGRADLYVSRLMADGARYVAAEGSTLTVDLGGSVTIPWLVRALVEAGADVTSVIPDEAPLEDVYLRLLAEDRT